jgi:hypothetical protein
MMTTVRHENERARVHPDGVTVFQYYDCGTWFTHNGLSRGPSRQMRRLADAVFGALPKPKKRPAVGWAVAAD